MANGSSYKKKGGYRPPLPVRETKKKEKPLQGFSKQELSSGYTKPEGSLEPALIVIFSGGNERERLYFQLIETAQSSSFPRITLKTICHSSEQPDGGLSPKQLYCEAEKIKKTVKKKRYGARDENYLVCDVDHFIGELRGIKPLCEQRQYGLIISNSCFEIWLYYGKHSAKPNEHETPFSCPSNPLEISQAFKTYLGEVVNGGIDPRKALYDIETAIDNARNHYSHDEHGIPHLYCTNMFLLADRLLELINPELDELRKQNKEKQEKFKQQNNRKKLEKV